MKFDVIRRDGTLVARLDCIADALRLMRRNGIGTYVVRVADSVLMATAVCPTRIPLSASWFGHYQGRRAS